MVNEGIAETVNCKEKEVRNSPSTTVRYVVEATSVLGSRSVTNN
jgi:hypothetical protein